MTTWADTDFVILRKQVEEDGTVQSLEGRVVEQEPREQPLELSVAQVIDYISQGGVFYTGRQSFGEINKGGKLEVIEEQGGEQLRLRTVEPTDESFQLSSLPEFQS